MAETANYTYEGDAHIKLSGTHAQTIEINSIQHMVPINVSCTVDGQDSLVTAFIDYATQQIVVSPEANPTIQDMESFKDSLSRYLANTQARMKQEMEVDFPAYETPGYTIPAVPEVDRPHTGVIE